MTKRGLYNLDPTRKGFGYGVNGAMTKYVKVPARILHHVPDQLPFEQACLTEPCCVAYNAVVKNARIEPGDRVIVLGPGTIGILCAAMAKLCGAEVALVGLPQDAHRLEIAKGYGCEVIIGDAKPWALERDGLGWRWCDQCRRSRRRSQNRPRRGAASGLDQQGWLGPATSSGSTSIHLVQKNVTLQGSFSHNWPICGTRDRSTQ